MDRAHTKGRERPILFSAPMVRALLEGRKTQTRRIIKPRGRVSLFDGSWSDSYVLDPGNQSWRDQEIRIQAGGRLWVREVFQEFLASEFPPGRSFGPRGEFGIPAERAKGNVSYVAYRADGEFPPHPEEGKAVWRSPIFMPRKFSRLTLTVTDVRVQRLQEIGEEDARAEGAPDFAADFGADDIYPATGETNREISDRLTWCKRWYSHLWDSINGAGSWEANPWVAAYTFTVERRNIDEGRSNRADAISNPSPSMEGR